MHVPMSAMRYKTYNLVLSPQDQHLLTANRVLDSHMIFHGGPTSSKENHLDAHFRMPQRIELAQQILCSFLADARCIQRKTYMRSLALGATW